MIKKFDLNFIEETKVQGHTISSGVKSQIHSIYFPSIYRALLSAKQEPGSRLQDTVTDETGTVTSLTETTFKAKATTAP